MLLLAAGVWAHAQDTVTLRSSLSIANTDNFLRSPDGAQVADRTTVQSMGIAVSIPYSLQRFEVDMGVSSNQHQTFANFDYTAYNYNAAWRWSYTPRFHGSLSTRRAETLNPTGDSVNPNLRNKNTSVTTGLAAVYEMGGPWQLLGGYTSTASLNEQALIGQGDNRNNSMNLGARYLLSSGSSLGYSAQRGEGSTTSGYTQNLHDLNVLWALTPDTSLTANVSYLEQNFGNTPQMNFSGYPGSVRLNWRLSGKTSLGLGWNRALFSYPTNASTHSRLDSLSIAPVWNISAHTSLQLQYQHGIRSDQGAPNGVASTRQDRTQDITLSGTWQPRPFASLSLSVGHAMRSSDAVGQDYTAKNASVAAQFTF
jgi:exopolysaccharide biosynthesis operon protein EpsL